MAMLSAAELAGVAIDALFAGGDHETLGAGFGGGGGRYNGGDGRRVVTKRLRAVYQSGVFLLEEPCDLPEGSRVELAIQGSLVQAPGVSDPVERECLMKALLERMRANPIPAQAPRLTRDMLYDRS